MTVITVDQARAGMTLAVALKDRKGRMLIPAGHELGERHVHALLSWGVTQLEIEGEGDAPDLTSEFSDEVTDRAARETEAAFADNDPEHPFISAVRRYATSERAAYIANAGAAVVA